MEYGKLEELRGLKKVFVDTAGDTQNRDRILKEIDRLGLQVMEAEDDADMVLKYRGKVQNLETDGVRHDLSTGFGMVVVWNPRTEKMRVLLSVENSQQSNLEKNPSVKFAKEFVKAYKRANGIK